MHVLVLRQFLHLLAEAAERNFFQAALCVGVAQLAEHIAHLRHVARIQLSVEHHALRHIEL